MRIYNVKYSIEGFSLEIKEMILEERKINIIIGENGSGKSTLLKLLIEDKINNDISSKSLLLQKPFKFNMTVKDIVIRTLKWNDSSISVDDFLRKYGLENKEKLSVKKLSGGEFRRLYLGLTLLSDKDLIILDEPFVGIDVASQHKMLEILLNEKQKRTILLISHKMNICRRIGDKLFFIKNGRLICEGHKEEFFRINNESLQEFLSFE